MERVAGIEPAWLAWKASALPLSYTRDQRRLMSNRVFMVSKPRFRLLCVKLPFPLLCILAKMALLKA